MKNKKLSRETVSLEKEGKKRRAEVLRNTENEEWENEVKEYGRHINVRGWTLPYEDGLLPPSGTTQ
jgi:restriction endonuclease S subunit